MMAREQKSILYSKQEKHYRERASSKRTGHKFGLLSPKVEAGVGPVKSKGIHFF